MDDQNQVHEDWWNPPPLPPQGSDLGAALARVGNIPTQDIPTIEPAPLIPRSLSEGVSNRAQNLWDEFKQSRLSGQTAAGVGATLDPMAAIPGANAGLAADELRAMYHSRLGTRELPSDYDLYKYYNAENAARERFARENPETAQTMGSVMEAGLSHPSGMGHVPPAAETAVEKGRNFVEQNAPGPNQVQMFLAAEPRQAAAAEALERQGVHRNDIWRQTKAFRDTDGEWKREISDAPSRINPEAEEWMMKSGEGAQGLAPDVYEHPEAYEQLPGLRRHLVAMSPADEYRGGYTPAHTINPAYIEARGRTPEEIRWVMAHEMQHAADELAGLPAGSSPEIHYERLKGASPHSVAALSRDLANKGYENVPNFANYNDWDKYLRDLSKTLYRIDNSEVRARAAAERLNMTEEQRAATHPFESMDVPPEQQIIRKRQPGGMQQAASESTSASVPVTQPAPRSIDPLGYYSQALEAAKALPQAKGTPEQMLAQLKKAGVKDAEIQATNLPQFLEGKKSITRDEIAQHLEQNRVEPRQVIRSKSSERATPEMLDETARDEGYDNFQHFVNVLRTDPEIGENDANILIKQLRDKADLRARTGWFGDTTKWSSYSLDPNNPTYRETVLHLPDQLSAKRQDIQKQFNEYLDRYRTGTGRLDTPEYEALTQELDNLDRQISENPARNFQSGHFGEPNITGHLMTSMVKDQNGRNVFNVDQIQSDWGQKLREGGVRDEAKIADIQRQYDANDKKSQEAVRAAFSYVSAKTKGRNWLQTIREVADAGDKEAQRLLGDYLRTDREAKRLAAELSTAQHAVSGHPLVNTTDQWTNTTLRHAIKQAVESGADAISIPHGDTVLSYNPGKEKGMRGFYGTRTQEGIVPKNLRKLLQAIDKDAPSSYRTETLNTSSGTQGYATHELYPFDKTQTGFTVFPLTDKIKQSVLKEGQPLFASGGAVSRDNDFHESKLNNIFETMMDEHPDMVPPSGSFIPKEGIQPDDPNFGNFRAIGSAFKYNTPPDARESTNIEDRRYTHPSLPTSDFGTYNGPMMGDPSPYRPAANSSAAGIQGMSGTQSGPSVTRAPWTATSISPFKTEVVSAQAHGGTVTMDNSMTKGSEQSNQASSVNPEQHAFNPEHLPEHERAHIENPQDAHSKAAWMLPYLRAGAESVKRGGDFFGGDPQYERELSALKHFYHGPKQAATAPESPTNDEAPTARKHGGPVHKKVVHIHDAFKHRLEGQERKLSSMEKAHARKANPMLFRRIDLEKKEVERMRKHIDKIKSHIS